MTTTQDRAQTARVTVNDVTVVAPRVYDDDRARRTNDVFGAATPGDINISIAYPGRIVAWHRHQKQTDHWHVVKGYLKVGLLDDHGTVRWVYLGENDRRTLSIPPGIWHGYMVLGNEEAVLMYYITQPYDLANPDEERLTVEEAGIDWSVPIK